MIRELLRIYDAADDELREAGRGWYPAAEREAERVASYAPDGIGPIRAAGIIAALSPRAQWSVNLRWALAIAADADAPVSFRANRAKARAIRQGGHPAHHLRGPKVRAFWRNLCGDPLSVTLDTWAIRPFGWEQRDLDRRGNYKLAARAYQLAADARGERPCDFQAIVWMALRGVKPTDPDGFRPARKVGCEL